MHGILLEYQPFAPGAFFFVLLGFICLTIFMTLIALTDLVLSKFKETGDRLTWTLLILCTLGLSSYIYFFKRKKMVLKRGEIASPDIENQPSPLDQEE